MGKALRVGNAWKLIAESDKRRESEAYGASGSKLADKMG